MDINSHFDRSSSRCDLHVSQHKASRTYAACSAGWRRDGPLYAKLQLMRDFGEYLRAYWAYVSTNLGWRKALTVALVWLAGMFAPLGVKTFVQLPNWVTISWMVGWALFGYVFAPYGMWKAQRKK